MAKNFVLTNGNRTAKLTHGDAVDVRCNEGYVVKKNPAEKITQLSCELTEGGTAIDHNPCMKGKCAS